MIPNVGIVSYKNTEPLQYGLRQLEAQGEMVLSKEYPALLAQKLELGELDLALVPVAFLKGKENFHIIGNHCIASDKIVASVCIFSHCPIDEIKNLYLDFQSRTSIQLAKILMERYWHLDINYIAADEHYIQHIQGNTAGVIIGDRAFEYSSQFPYCYDLAEAWFALTGLPFVFAVWVSQKSLDPIFIEKFEAANQKGLFIKKEIADQLAYPHYDLFHYYTENINYQLDEGKRKAIQLFLNMF